jgi:imidazolonepropionase-like amidohydrolase
MKHTIITGSAHKSRFTYQEKNMKIFVTILISFCLVLSACASSTPSSYQTQATLVLTNGTLIDGTGADPDPNATLVLGGNRILAVGPASQVAVPEGVEVIDLAGAFILPGFINAHVHDAYDKSRLEVWAQAGVTTVCDEGILTGPDQLSQLIALRDQLASSPQNARLISAGYMLTVPGGYGNLEVTSAEDARQKVNMELDAGADLIKVAIETGYAGVSNLPILSNAELSAIVAATHARLKLVSAHVTQAQYLQMVINNGVDVVEHIPADFVPGKLIQQMIDQNMVLVPTLTVMDAYGALSGATFNLRRFVKEGVQIALGNDYTAVPQNNFDHFDLGMPMYEINLMSEADMTPMQIIVAATRNAAHVCGLEQELGTLEAGKIADILIISANPLQDLSALTQVKMVIHNGEIIRR